MTRGKHWSLGLAGLAAAGAATGVALASTKTLTDKQDVKCYQGTRVISCAKAPGGKNIADIKSVNARTGKGQIRFEITTYNDVVHKLSRSGPNSSPPVVVFMQVGRGHYITGSMGSGLKVINNRNGKITGSVTFKAINKHTELMIFGKRAIGSPSTFKWRATDPSCESCGPVNDQAPNKGFVSQHT